MTVCSKIWEFTDGFVDQAVVGAFIDGMEAVLDEDGEILLRIESIMDERDAFSDTLELTEAARSRWGFRFGTDVWSAVMEGTGVEFREAIERAWFGGMPWLVFLTRSPANLRRLLSIEVGDGELLLGCPNDFFVLAATGDEALMQRFAAAFEHACHLREIRLKSLTKSRRYFKWR